MASLLTFLEKVPGLAVGVPNQNRFEEEQGDHYTVWGSKRSYSIKGFLDGRFCSSNTLIVAIA